MKIEPDRPYSVSLASATASRLVVERHHRDDRAEDLLAPDPGSPGRLGRAPRSAAPRSRRRPGCVPGERDLDARRGSPARSRAAAPRSAGPSRCARRAGSSTRSPAPPAPAGRGTRRTPTARPGSASGRSSPGRRCRRRRTARRRPRPARSASAKTMLALLPPSSRVTRFTWSAQPAMIRLPTSVEPVKQTLRTSGWVTNRSPTTEPLPGSTVSTSSGRPASSASSPSRMRGQRGQLGRLEHDGVAGGQRRREAPAGDRHREVPRHDDADDAERLVEGDVDAAGDRDLPAEQPLRRRGVVVEAVADVAGLPAGVAPGVAGVARPRARPAPRRARRPRRRTGAAAWPARPGAIARQDGTPRGRARSRRRLRGQVGERDVGDRRAPSPG